MRNAKDSILLQGLAACGLALIAGREFYKRSVIPLRQQEQEVLREIGDLPERIHLARIEIARICAEGKREFPSGSEANRLRDGFDPRSEPPSVPALVGGHFAKFGFRAPAVLRTASSDAPGLPDYEISSWRVIVSIAKDADEVASVVRATEALEPQGSSFKIRDFTLWPDPADSTRQHATIRLSFLSQRTDRAR